MGKIGMPSIRSAVAGALIIGSVALAGSASAATINNYSFTQDGYFSPNLASGITATLSGSFSGTVEPSGLLQLADLTAFSYTFTLYDSNHNVFASVITGDLSDLAHFSYQTDGSASTLFISALSATGVCTGAAAGLFGYCGGPTIYNSASILGSFAYLATAGQPDGPSDPAFVVSSAAPEITLTSVTTTPIPPALPLFASSLAALGFAGWRRRARRMPRAA